MDFINALLLKRHGSSNIINESHNHCYRNKAPFFRIFETGHSLQETDGNEFYSN